jgi:hypothetical protein
VRLATGCLRSHTFKACPLLYAVPSHDSPRISDKAMAFSIVLLPIGSAGYYELASQLAENPAAKLPLKSSERSSCGSKKYLGLRSTPRSFLVTGASPILIDSGDPTNLSAAARNGAIFGGFGRRQRRQY